MKSKRVSVRLTPEQYDKLVRVADQEGRSINTQIEHWINKARLARDEAAARRTATPRPARQDAGRENNERQKDEG